MLNQKNKTKSSTVLCGENDTALPFLFFLAVWSRFKALTAGSFVLMLLQLKSAWELPMQIHLSPTPFFLMYSFSSSFSFPPLLLPSPPFLSPLHPPAAPLPPPPASLLFLSSTHVRLSTTKRLKIASGIPASIQREAGGTSGHKPTFQRLSWFVTSSACFFLCCRLEFIKDQIVSIFCKSHWTPLL